MFRRATREGKIMDWLIGFVALSIIALAIGMLKARQDRWGRGKK